MQQLTIARQQPLVLASVFLWLGFLGTISFMEAWLKFRAPGITLELGLGIGRLVFNALNKVEWVLLLSILGGLLYYKQTVIQRQLIFLVIPCLLLLLQTLWLLPALDHRAEMAILKQSLPPSNLHFYYVVMEIIKAACLFSYGKSLFKIRAISEATI
ncbi:hypothetical protein [Rasiella sp. SM2506]|uniref:hypothetical protein n=1 Tax=Rasiella sp. SM2506 TaxID=3423914 RepID=UPI003D7AF954